MQSVRIILLSNLSKMKHILYILSIVLLFGACSNDPIVAAFINLDKNETTVEPEESRVELKVSSNIKWSMEDIPDWASADKTSGTGGDIIVSITIKANETYQERKATIKVFNEGLIKSLTITQKGIKKEDSPEWVSFPVNGFTSVKPDSDEGKIAYDFKAQELFINKGISSKIYLGNLINHKFSSITELVEFKDFTYNPITVSSLVNGETFIETFVPAKDKLDNLSQKIIDALPKQNNSFITGSPIIFDSYKQLFLLGNGNLGEDIPKLISGNSYTQKEMKKQIGLIYTFSQNVFSIIMDLPNQLITETLDEQYIINNNLSYISSISYGRTAYLVVESDYNKEKIRPIIDKIFKEQELTTEESDIIKNLDVHYLYFSPDVMLNAESGDNIELIKKYTEISGLDIIPLSFSISNYGDNSMADVEYKVAIP